MMNNSKKLESDIQLSLKKLSINQSEFEQQDLENIKKYISELENTVSFLASKEQVYISQLEQQALLYNSLFDQMQEGFALHEIITDETGKPVDYIYLDVNHSFELITGKNKSEIVGKKVTELLPYHSNTLIEKFGEVALTGKNISLQNYSPILDKHFFVSSYSPKKNQFVTIFSDISNILMKETELKEINRKNQTLLSNLPGIAYRCKNDPDWTMEFMSDGCLDLTGYLPPELINNSVLSWNDLIEASDKQYVWDSVEKAIDSQEKFEIIYRIRTKNSQIRWVWERGQGVFSDENQLIAIEGFINDFTQIKHAEEILSLNELRYKSLYNNTPVMMHSIDSKGILLSVSDYWLDKLGYSRDEVIGRKSTEFLTDESKNYAIEKVLPEYYKTGIISDISYDFVKKDGDILHTSMSAISEKDEFGNISRSLAVIIDITDFKHLQESSSQSETMYRSLIEQMYEGVIQVDNEDRIIYVNPRMAESLGYDSNELIGKIGYETILFNEDKDLIIHKNKTRESGISEHYELTMKRKDGSPVYFFMSASPISDYEGNIIGSFSVCLDISERKKFEEEIIKAKNKAEESDKLKSSFLQNMSHEIRTPLNGIVGFSNLLKDFEALDSVDKINFIDMIISSSKRLLGIVNDVMEVSRLDTGLLTKYVTSFNVQEIINYLNNLYSEKITQRGLGFRIEISDNLKSYILKTDREKLFQIITNLLNNAVKFTDSGSIIFGCNELQNNLVFFVKDTGIGIKQEFQDKIYDRFWQYEAFTKKKYGGTGLGLSISRGLANLLNANLSFESTYGEGTTFYLTIAYEQINMINQSAKLSDSIKSMEDLSNVRILIAEDEITNYLYLETILKKESAKLFWVQNGLEAVLSVEKEKPHIILMDIKMPIMDGYESTKIIKEKYPEIPIIAQSAYSHQEEIQRAFESGCNEFMSKPLDRNELLTAINSILNKS